MSYWPLFWTYVFHFLTFLKTKWGVYKTEAKMSDNTFLCNGQVTQYPNWLQRADAVRPKEWFKNVVRQMISLDALIFLFVLTNIHPRWFSATRVYRLALSKSPYLFSLRIKNCQKETCGTKLKQTITSNWNSLCDLSTKSATNEEVHVIFYSNLDFSKK